MRELGVSKIVTVKFHKANEPPTQTATASLKTPTANPVDAEEDAPHKSEERLEITTAK